MKTRAERNVIALYKHYDKDMSGYLLAGIFGLLEGLSDAKIEKVIALLKFRVTGMVQYQENGRMVTTKRQPLGVDWDRAISDLEKNEWNLASVLKADQQDFCRA